MEKCKYCCSHENIKFCPICGVVFCEDCKREWGIQYPHKEIAGIHAYFNEELRKVICCHHS